MSGLFGIAGWMWSPGLVGWGRPGPTMTREMLGYYNAKLDGGRGRVGLDQRVRQTINAWYLPGLYALYKADTLVYIGQAKQLGERLLAHFRRDHLVGRWDAFSWVSPSRLRVAGGQNGGCKRLEIDSRQLALGATDLSSFLNEMEAFAIFFGNPLENRQSPGLGQHTYWLEQARSSHADLTTEEMVKELYRVAVLSSS